MKMNKMWKRHGIELRPGTVLNGKWHKKRYIIVRKLGAGTVGTVYLCECNGKYAALKISEQNTSMTLEVNVLKALKTVQGSVLGPNLLDVDDVELGQGKTYSFYVMEYLQGDNIDRFIKKNGVEWIGVFMLQLLTDLERLHQAGWVFGDLKLDNLIVVSSPTRVRFVDVGGTTQIGRAIKEYTEFFDRGYWGLGTRKAEPSYDLFSLGMVILAVFYPSQFERTTQPEKTIISKINNVPALQPYRLCLRKAIGGGYKTSADMKQDLVNVLHRRQISRQKRKQKDNKVNRMPMLVETGAILFIATCYYVTSLFLF